ncbi:hypothetical protein PV325_004523 [Microctonus aethiopoides]|nr:hypothetical protein PV325_004523 [Microctonus aethiopoides]
MPSATRVWVLSRWLLAVDSVKVKSVWRHKRAKEYWKWPPFFQAASGEQHRNADGAEYEEEDDEIEEFMSS